MGGMSSDTAERWVVISALIVAGIYAYRRLAETTADVVSLKSIVGIGKPPPLGTFVTAWGFTFLGVSILASANAQLGGAFAILIATSDFLTNAPAVVGDVQKHTQVTGGTPAKTGQQITTAGQEAGNAIAGVGQRAPGAAPNSSRLAASTVGETTALSLAGIDPLIGF